MKILSRVAAGLVLMVFTVTAGAQENGLSLLYTFDETEGINVNDSSGKENHALLTNTDWSESSVPGQFGNAVSFDGIDDWVAVNIDDPVDLPGPEAPFDTFTIGMWLKSGTWEGPTPENCERQPVCANTRLGQIVGFDLDDAVAGDSWPELTWGLIDNRSVDGLMAWWAEGFAPDAADDPINPSWHVAVGEDGLDLSVDDWHQFTVLYNPTDGVKSVWIDGTSMPKEGIQAFGPPTEEHFSIGANNPIGQIEPTEIQVDDLFVYIGELSEAQITDVINNGASILLGSDSLSPDFDGDGTVNFGDFVMFSNAFGSIESDDLAVFDLDMSGLVDFGDFVQFSNAFGQMAESSSVPEPNGILMAILGLMAMLGYRRTKSF